MFFASKFKFFFYQNLDFVLGIARASRSIASLLFCGSLQLVKSACEASAEPKKESMTSLLEDDEDATSVDPGQLEMLLNTVSKKQKRLRTMKPELLAAVSEQLPPFCFGSTGMLREAAKIAWRELSAFTPDEVVEALLPIASRNNDEESDEEMENADAKKDDNASDAESGSDIDDEEIDVEAAKMMKLLAMDGKIKADDGSDSGSDEDEDDNLGKTVIPENDEETLTDERSLMDLLCDDGNDATMQAFIGMTPGANRANEKKAARKDNNNAVHQQMQAAALVDIFLARQLENIDRAAVCFRIMEQLFDALVEAGKKGRRAGKDQSMKDDLQRRLGQVLRSASKALPKKSESLCQKKIGEMAERVLTGCLMRSGVASFGVDIYVALLKSGGADAKWVKKSLTEAMTKWCSSRTQVDADFFKVHFCFCNHVVNIKIIILRPNILFKPNI